MERIGTMRVCQNCGKEFYIEPYRMKRPGSPGRFCTMECRTREGGWHPRQKQLDLPIDEIKNLYAAGHSLQQIAAQFSVSTATIVNRMDQARIKRRPPTGANLRQPEIRAKSIERLHQQTGEKNGKYKHLPIDELCSAYQSGDSLQLIAKRYSVTAGTVGDKLRAAGVNIRPMGFSRFTKALDGHSVQSRWEYLVDSWLCQHGIAHETQVRCPWTHRWETRRLADFRVGDVFIEVWGTLNAPQYVERRTEKLARYHEASVSVIEIFWHQILDSDFSPLASLLNLSD